MFKILVLDKIDSICKSKLDTHPLFNIEIINDIKKHELLNIIGNYNALLVRSATTVDDDILKRGKNLKLIGRAGTGVDNIDVESATRHGIIVLNTPNANTLSAAEHTCGLILSLARFIPQAVNSLKSDKWDRSKYLGSELFGKTLAIIGLGRIGFEVATRMNSFGMKIIGFDPLVLPEKANQYGIQWMKLNEIWPMADYITVHTPLIPQTKNLLNKTVFKQCKKGFKVINCARGGIINEEDLLWSLEEGLCLGAGLDVYTREPPDFVDVEGALYKLLHHPLVICTPHLGASTVDAQKRVAEELADSILALASSTDFQGLLGLNNLGLTHVGKAITGSGDQNGVPLAYEDVLSGIVNGQSLKWELNPESKDWMRLANGMGYIFGKIIDPIITAFDNEPDSFKEAVLKFIVVGKEIKSISKALNDSFLTGMISALTVKLYNIINGPVAMRTRYPFLSNFLTTDWDDLSSNKCPSLSLPSNFIGFRWEFPFQTPKNKPNSSPTLPFSLMGTVISGDSFIIEFCGNRMWPRILLKLDPLLLPLQQHTHSTNESNGFSAIKDCGTVANGFTKNKINIKQSDDEVSALKLSDMGLNDAPEDSESRELLPAIHGGKNHFLIIMLADKSISTNTKIMEFFKKRDDFELGYFGSGGTGGKNKDLNETATTREWKLILADKMNVSGDSHRVLSHFTKELQNNLKNFVTVPGEEEILVECYSFLS